MKIVKSEKSLCMCCMEEHEVKTVLVEECATFKKEAVPYEAEYLYCDRAEELYMNEKQIKENDLRLKNAYRKKEGLLTSEDIRSIRAKYGINQSDFCILLGWGAKTITRYEGHQVQDKAHDMILKKVDQDIEWFLELLQDTEGKLQKEAYNRYLAAAMELYEKNQDVYLRKAIKANYVKFNEKSPLNGNRKLSLDKVVDVIRYFSASVQVTNLYKVKLMKMMWYADALSYKNSGAAITGLVYKALPMGAVPIGHDSIINLKGVPCEEEDKGEMTAYHFCMKDKTQEFTHLSETERKVLDIVIEKLGRMSKNEIVSFMHQEQAYKKTKFRDVISFEYAETLQI